MLELIEEADRLGAGATIVGEHHLDIDSHFPQPLTFAAAAAARTAVLATMSSPPAEMVATMERHGVVQPLTVYIEK